MSNNHKTTKPGFTIIELMLAMAFLATLLLAIAIIIINITTIYQKGLAIKSVNSTGRELIDDFSRTIASSPAKSISGLCSTLKRDASVKNCEKDRAYLFTYQQNYTRDITINNKEADGPVPTSGVFCTGRYSYIWNTGYAISVGGAYANNENAKASIKYKVQGNPTTVDTKDFRLLKLIDSDRKLCNSRIDLDNYTYPAYSRNPVYDITKNGNVLSEDPVELLTVSEDNLALYDFTIFPPTQNITTLHTFYSGTFILATLRGGVDITAAGDYCTDTPEGLTTDFNYCALNKFNFAARATGELKDEEEYH